MPARLKQNGSILNLDPTPVATKQMSATPTGQKIFGGTISVFLAEALLLPTGIITAACLSRQLGPDGYGLFTLAATLIGWIGWSITSVFTRTTIKFVSEAEDWRSIGAALLRLHLLLGGGVMLLIWLLADPIATRLNEPDLALYLRLFAIDLPLFCVGYVHRSILVGIGRFQQRAIATAGRWLARMILIIGLVAMGLSVPGAILGSIGASGVELLICRCYVRPLLFDRDKFPMRKLWNYAVPLFLFALSMRLYEKLDLFALKLMGGTAAQIGYYGAAQNLALIPGIFSLSFSPLLLSTLTRMLAQGDSISARQISRNAMRAIVLMLPLAGLTAGAAPEIVQFIFGATFGAAAPILAILIFGAIALAMISVTTAILTAAGKPNWTFALAAPLVPLAIAGDLVAIPRLGASGAALVTTTVASLGAIASVLMVYRLWQILPSWRSLLRAILLCGCAYGLASIELPPSWVLPKLLMISLSILLGLLLSGEFTYQEQAQIRSLVHAAVVSRLPSR
jgi:O-antigen/teichoic acid export membrane protein